MSDIITSDASAIALSDAERNAIFRRLRQLNSSFGRKRNLNEVAATLIAACIAEGFDTSARIIGALVRLKFKPNHVCGILNQHEGRNPSCHLWQSSGERYHLLEP